MRKLYLRVFLNEDDFDHGITVDVDPREVLRLKRIVDTNGITGVYVPAKVTSTFRVDTLAEAPADGIVGDALKDLLEFAEGDPDVKPDVELDDASLFVTDKGFIYFDVYDSGETREVEGIEISKLGAGPLLLDKGDKITCGGLPFVVETASWTETDGYYVQLTNGRNIKERVDGVTVTRAA